MSEQQPTWEQKLSDLRQKYDDIRSSIGMDDVTRTLGDVATDISGLPDQIAKLRDRGYAFASYLERKSEVLATQWNAIRGQVQTTVRHEIDRIQAQFDEVSDSWPRLESHLTGTGRDLLFNQVKNKLDELENAITAAKSRIEGLYGGVPDNVSQTQAQIRQIEEYLKLAEESKIQWGPAEALYMAHEAEWRQTGKGKEDPDGILYITDQRLIFERKEKVGGRLGFGGEKVQEVVFESTIGAISEVKHEDKGLFGGKDIVHLKFSQGDYAETSFEVKSGGIDSKWYMQQLQRAISGEIDKERAIPVDKAAEEALKAAPTVCTTCGATLPTPVRGMTEMVCEYCGTKMRI
jgi:archaellum component FlaC